MNAKKILIVEDYAPLLNALLLALNTGEWEILTATDGEQAICKLLEYKPDLMLLDIYMPKMNGFQVLEEISKNNELKDIPVIVISNFMDVDDLEKIKKYKVKKYFIKTAIKISDFRDIIKEYL